MVGGNGQDAIPYFHAMREDYVASVEAGGEEGGEADRAVARQAAELGGGNAVKGKDRQECKGKGRGTKSAGASSRGSTEAEQVTNECHEHMGNTGKSQLLLCTLGVALSHTARCYLKQTHRGLKHFLSQYPLEFSMDGLRAGS